MKPSEELILLIKLKSGDRKAFDEIYKLYSPLIYGRFLQLLKDHRIVEELVQDVFLKIWLLKGDLDPDRGFRTFLYRMVSNIATDVLRKIINDHKMREDLWYQFSLQVNELESNIDKADQNLMLRDAIDQLPPKQREIFIKCKIEEKSYKEVAKEMGISISTVSNQLVTAVKEVKSIILKSYTDDKFKMLIVSFLIYFLKKN